MKPISSETKTIRELLGGAKFAIEDYYQREYRWEKKQVLELINDLAEKFLESYRPGVGRGDVEKFGHYFLGSIIISDRDGKEFIIDGQQRLTSVTLLLIYLYHQLKNKQQLADLICSEKYGKCSFNLDIDDRAPCMESLFAGKDSEFDDADQSESVANILKRFKNIEENFPDDLTDEALPYFKDWLIENVYFIKITAYSDADAYTIFETMNDRGLSLTPTDMLKGYLLANIEDSDRREKALNIWKEHVSKLRQIGKEGKEEDADSIKAWLRSQHARTIRERKRDAHAEDFDLIGTEFHRWVRDHETLLGLTNSNDYSQFIEKDFSFYSRWYQRIREVAESFDRAKEENLEAIHYNAQNNFTLQYPALLASLRQDDSEEDILRKLRIVANCLDILIALRIWNGKAISYSDRQYNMFKLVILKIRGKPAPELTDILIKYLVDEKYTFSSNERFHLHGRNGPQIHRLLAHMTDYVETRSEKPSRYSEYIQRGGKNGYEIEHIWANHFDQHTDEFTHPSDFDGYRDRIGGLLLIPKKDNASYGDKPYAEKRKHYLKQNLLAQSLHEDAYKHNPGFCKFLKESGLKFKSHNEFKKKDLDDRQELYRTLAEQIWNPENLLKEVGP